MCLFYTRFEYFNYFRLKYFKAEIFDEWNYITRKSHFFKKLDPTSTSAFISTLLFHFVRQFSSLFFVLMNLGFRNILCFLPFSSLQRIQNSTDVINNMFQRSFKERKKVNGSSLNDAYAISLYIYISHATFSRKQYAM